MGYLGADAGNAKAMALRVEIHARARAPERGASEDEIVSTVLTGERFSAKFGRIGFRRNFRFGGIWRGKALCYKADRSLCGRGCRPLVGHNGHHEVFLKADAMKLAYDRDRNIAYLRLRPEDGEVETIRVSDELNVDIAPEGSVYGIELLNANEQLRAVDGGKLVLVDEVNGRESAISLAPG